MSTNTIIGLLVAVLVVGGGIWYFGSGTQSGDRTGQTGMEHGNENSMGSGSIMDFMNLGGSSKCTVTDAASGYSGTVYVADGRVRGDFTGTVDGQAYDSHFINSDGYIYNWSSAMPQGIKMKAPETDGQAMMDGQAPAGGGVDMNATVDYSCEPWTGSASAFAPPAEVEFMDFSAGMGVPGAMPSIPELPAGYP